MDEWSLQWSSTLLEELLPVDLHQLQSIDFSFIIMVAWIYFKYLINIQLEHFNFFHTKVMCFLPPLKK